MKNIKKLFLGVASIITIAAPIVATVSCGSTILSDEGIRNLPANDVSAETTFVCTDGVDKSIYDNSFNKQATDALLKIRNTTKLTNDMYYMPDFSYREYVVNGYDYLSDIGAKTILAPGYRHQDVIDWYIRRNKNKLNFILADGEVKAGNVASIQFNTKQPGFLAGITAARYLTIDAPDHDDIKTHVVGTFGGGNFPGVTDMMVGFVAGIRAWNEKFSTDTTKQIKFAAFKTQDDFTKFGFQSPGGVDAAKELIVRGARVILPVAGDETADVLQTINEMSINDSIGGVNQNYKIKVIGVDKDQSHEKYPRLQFSYEDKFLTSIIKNTQKALEDVYDVVSGAKKETDTIKGFGGTTQGTFENGLIGLAKSTKIDTVNKVLNGWKTGGSLADSEKSIYEAFYNKATTSEDLANMDWDEAYEYIKTFENTRWGNPF